MPVPVPPMSPREILDAYHRAMRDKSPDDLADLYAVDAVHEFPFAAPGFPPCFTGREEVRAGYRAAWGGSPVTVRDIRDVVVHETADPAVLIAEHVVVGTLPGPEATVTVPGLLVLRVDGAGRLAHVRDYMDGYGVAAARGHGVPDNASAGDLHERSPADD